MSGRMTRADLRMNLNLFRVLDAVYTHGGISAAARALHLTQPAITHSLNRLRELFGDPLFLRQGNRMVPTDRVRTVTTLPSAATGWVCCNWAMCRRAWVLSWTRATWA